MRLPYISFYPYLVYVNPSTPNVSAPHLLALTLVYILRLLSSSFSTSPLLISSSLPFSSCPPLFAHVPIHHLRPLCLLFAAFLICFPDLPTPLSQFHQIVSYTLSSTYIQNPLMSHKTHFLKGTIDF